MRKFAALAAFCSLLAVGCSSGPAEPDVKAPRVEEGRITTAVIAGRDLPIFTFTGGLQIKEGVVVGQRVIYSRTGDLYKRGGGKVDLIDPVTIDADYVTRLHQLRYITDKVKDRELEEYFNSDAARVAFRWEVDYKAKDGTDVYTHSSVVYETKHADIKAADLAREIKP